MEMKFAVSTLPFGARLALFLASAVGGAAVQFLLPGVGGTLLGLLVMVPGVVLMWMRNYRNKPMDLGLEDWQPATAAEFNRIKANLTATKKQRFSALHRGSLGVMLVVVAVGLALFVGLGGSSLAGVAFLDAAVLLLPFAFSGNVTLWTPRELAFKMACLEPLAGAEPEGGTIIVTPYLRLDKDKENHQIPEDVRLMVEPRRKPADFLGAQFQVAINNGPNGAVPYLYAVFLCRGKGPTYQAIEKMDFDTFVDEPGGDKEYGYVVVRQQTSGGGYHTDPGDCRRLYAMVRDRLLRLGTG
jgi:hypothetical protein